MNGNRIYPETRFGGILYVDIKLDDGKFHHQDIICMKKTDCTH